MRTVSADQMRELDRRTIEEAGIPGETLMGRAGRGLADSVLLRGGWMGPRFRGVIGVAGRGNNGGDACVACRIIKEAGIPALLLTACDPNDLKGDAALHFKKMLNAGVEVRALPDESDWDLSCELCEGMVVLDGLLGTGTTGGARGTVKSAINWINTCRSHAAVAAIDIPSGLNSDTGAAEGDAVRADWTVTMGLPKRGLIVPHALEYVGNLEVIDIGIPGSMLPDAEPPVFLAGSEMRLLLPARPVGSHKGSHGSALVIAGSRQYPGAAVLCAMGAVRSGAGLVTVMTAGDASAIVSAAPEAIAREVGASDQGGMDLVSLQDAVGDLGAFDSVTVGPGLTNSEDTVKIVRWVLENAGGGVLLDADALNSAAAAGISVEREDVVLTPHPGEAARLLDCSTATVQSNRIKVALELGRKYRGVTVLKGAGTLVCAKDDLSINMTGNAGMAKGGSGDVLAGLTGGLLAQKLNAENAAKLGVYVHGRAGDIAAFRGSMQGMTAGDLAACIPEAFSCLG